MLKTTEQNLIVCIGKSEAEVGLTIKHCARGIVLLKLTTDRHEELCGLSATAELLVLIQFSSSDLACKLIFVMYEQQLHI